MLKMRRCLAVAASLNLLLVVMPAAASTQGNDIEAVKAALLNDPLFLSHLRDRLSAETIDEDRVRSLVRTYLLDHPDLLLEMQEVLMAENELRQTRLQQETARILNENAQLLFANEHDHVLGNAQGDIRIVEFYDYNCGHCKAAYPAMLELLEQDKNLSVVMKDYPILGEDSGRAHLVAQAFKKMAPQHYADFHHRMMLLNARATEESALDVALSFGFDRAQLQAAMTQEEIQIPLVENARIAYQLGFNFTPVYIIGDEIIRGATDNAHMAALVKAQREAESSQDQDR